MLIMVSCAFMEGLREILLFYLLTSFLHVEVNQQRGGEGGEDCENDRGKGGEEGEESVSTFVIERETSEFYRRFGMEGKTLRGKFSGQLPDNVDLFRWIEGGFRDLYKKLCNKANPFDLIGITLHSNSFAHGRLWLSFRPVCDSFAEDLWNLFFEAAQSSKDFSLENSLDVKCAIIEGVSGSGRVKLTSLNVKKRSILQIRNNDNLCLPRSLVTAFAFALRGPIRTGELHTTWNKIRQARGKFQKSMALELV